MTTFFAARNICKSYPQKKGFWGYKRVEVIKNIHLDLQEGKTLGVVGESGCGKSTLAKILCGVLRYDSGEIFFENQKLTIPYAKTIHRQIQMVFQDPYSSLNPRMRLGAIVEEPLIIHGVHAKERKVRVGSMLERLGFTTADLDKYPHAFSGGQRQRIAIARSLVLMPKILICDEPVSALDLSLQAQILQLLDDLQKELHLSLIVITHDLRVVKKIAHDVIVMKDGEIVERGSADVILQTPQHPYTKSLLLCIPHLKRKNDVA